MNLFVDTSVWSMALSVDAVDVPEVRELKRALTGGPVIVTTGFIIQELLQRVADRRMRAALREGMLRLSYVTPDATDHVRAAELLAECRQRRVDLSEVDALIASVCSRRGLTMLTADEVILNAAPHLPLRIWRPHSHDVRRRSS